MKFLVTLLAVLFLAVPASADTKNCSIIAAVINPTEAGATDDWIDLADSTFTTTNAASDNYIMPYNAILSNFTVRVDVAPTANDSWNVYLSVNGTTAATSLVNCEIIGATQVACTPALGDQRSISVERGDDITVLVDSDDGTADPAAAAALSVSFCATAS